MKQPGLDGRHRDRDGEIDRKRSDTLIGTLRETYGRDFAPGWKDKQNLGELRSKTGQSLSELVRGNKK